MAAPSFVQASTGAVDTTGTFTFTGVATGTIGDLVILQILNDGGTSPNWGTISATNIENLAGTANSWTQAALGEIGSPAILARQLIYLGRRTSASSAPTFTGSQNASGEDLYGRMYEFSNVSTGTTLATVIEETTAGNVTNGAGTAASVTDTAVTTLGPDRLALNFVGISDDNPISAFTGETGGDWTLAVAYYAESSGTDGAIGLQIAYPGVAASDGTGSGDQVYGSGGTNEQVAQSFTTPASTVSVSNIALNVAKNGNPLDNFIVEIRTDNAGVPSSTVVGSASTTAGTALSAAGALTPFYVVATLSASTTYWIVIRRSGARDIVNYYIVNGSAAYAGGTAAVLASGTWGTVARDYMFSVGSSAGATIDGGAFTQADGTDGWGVVGFALIGTTVVLDQQHYRFRNDDGNETTATWLADLDTDVN